MSLQLRLPLLDLTAFKEPGIESRGRVSCTFKRYIRSDPDLPCIPSAINFLMNLKSISRQSGDLMGDYDLYNLDS